MSHTDKDLPYDVRALHSGLIEHDHATGTCVIGTRAESFARRRDRAAHHLTCPRYNYIVECVHNAAREEHQKKVNSARAAEKSYHRVHPDSYVDYMPTTSVVARPRASAAMRNMLDAGYVPNCDQTKTHLIDLRDLDLNLRPGERVSTPISRQGVFNYHRYYDDLYATTLLYVQYDENTPCDYCDTHPYITCYQEPTPSYGKHRYCSCYDETAKARYPKRSADRDDMKNFVKQYNTHGEVED